MNINKRNKIHSQLVFKIRNRNQIRGANGFLLSIRLLGARKGFLPVSNIRYGLMITLAKEVMENMTLNNRGMAFYDFKREEFYSVPFIRTRLSEDIQ